MPTYKVGSAVYYASRGDFEGLFAAWEAGNYSKDDVGIDHLIQETIKNYVNATVNVKLEDILTEIIQFALIDVGMKLQFKAGTNQLNEVFWPFVALVNNKCHATVAYIMDNLDQDKIQEATGSDMEDVYSRLPIDAEDRFLIDVNRVSAAY